MRTRLRRAGLLAVAVAASLVSSACTGGGSTPQGVLGDCAAKPNDCNAGQVRSGGMLGYAIEKKIKGWNLNAGGSNTADTGEVLAGVLPEPFIVNPDLSIRLNSDLLLSAVQTGTNPQTIVYKINPAAVWDDGTPISADDFSYSWRTQNGRDCPGCKAASTAGYEQVKSVSGADGGRTVTVVYDVPFADWQAVFAHLYPAQVGKQHGDLAASFAWFNENVPTWSGGPFTIAEYQKDQSVTLVPNPRWYGRLKPNLEKVVFRILVDQNEQIAALSRNDVQVVYTQQPSVDLVHAVKGLPKVAYGLGRGLMWEHLDLNLRNRFLAEVKLRRAIFTAVNRQAIIDSTVGQIARGLTPVNSHNFLPGQPGYYDVITPTGQGAGDVTRAKKILTDAGYVLDGSTLRTPSGEAVTLRIGYSDGNTARRTISEVFARQLAAIGVRVDISAVDLAATLAGGDYDVVVFASSGQPFPRASAMQAWLSTGGTNYGHWTNANSDVLLKEAASQTDPAKAVDALNEADVVLANDAYVLPLFQKPTLLALDPQYANVRFNCSLAGPAYNIAEWGMRG